jgi:hypothetical protein
MSDTVTLSDAQMSELAAKAAKLVLNNAKPVSSFTEITDYSNGVTIPVVQTNGQPGVFNAGKFFQNVKDQGAAAQAAANASYDNVFVMFHRKSDNFPLAVKPRYWTGYQNGGEIAEGVLVIEGDKHIVVAPTEATDKLLWSSGDITTGNATTADRMVVMKDFDGKARTAKAIAASGDGHITNTADYAPGFCNLYSRVNANGKGLIAGRWWLPSTGELFMMYSNMDKINYALSLITGATQLARDWYWSSLEPNAASAWILYLGNGALDDWYNKSQNKGHVRPVSAFLQ